MAGSIRFTQWFDETVLELGRHLRWSYPPPLMVYFAAGVSGITSIVGAFFVKDYLELSAVFLSGLAFWAGIPWALKMPLGHLVDIIWRWKHYMVYLGATIIATSITIMYGLITNPAWMGSIMSAESWYVASVLLAPTGYVIQDTVADAMTVEAVPQSDENGNLYPDDIAKKMHIAMQTLGRVAIVLGLIGVAFLNITMFSGVSAMSESEKLSTYADIYQLALLIPVISVAGVTLGTVMINQRKRHLISSGLKPEDVENLLQGKTTRTEPDYLILCGGMLFVVVTVGIGISQIPFDQEIIFVTSLAIVALLIHKLVQELDTNARNQLAAC